MAHELEDKGRFPVDTYPVTFHHLSVMDKTWDREAAALEDLPVAEFLHARYTEMLAEAGPRYADALRLLAAPEALPAVFHCAAGKDRTGVTAAVLLGLVGVERQEIIDDYHVTAGAMAAFVEWLTLEHPEALDAMTSQPPEYLEAPPAAMAGFLDAVDDTYGSMLGLADHLGVTAATIDRLQATLVD